MPDPIPIIVLGGSDSKPGTVPPGMQSSDMLYGAKGTIPLSTGRPMAGEVIARIRASGCFGEPLLLGPAAWYEGQIDCEVVSVEGTLVQTLRRLTETIADRFPGHDPVALTACDILPTAAEFRQLMETDYAPHCQSMFWWQMIRAEPEQMGTSAWKPRYQLATGPGHDPLTMYPGHVVIVRPDALRLQLTNRFLELAYRYRNRSLRKRFFGMSGRALAALAAQDIRNLREFQLPVLTFVLPFAGLRDLFKYRRGTATLHDHERFLRRALLHRRFLSANDNRPVVISLTGLQAFARDVDSRGELEELDRRDPDTPPVDAPPADVGEQPGGPPSENGH